MFAYGSFGVDLAPTPSNIVKHVHSYASIHDHHLSLYIITFLVFTHTHVHHTGSQEEVTVLEPEEQVEGAQLDVPAQEVQANEEADEELQECPDYRPSSFERGKPRSISPSVCKYLIYVLFMIDALSYRS
jgi:hypothetical protein